MEPTFEGLIETLNHEVIMNSSEQYIEHEVRLRVMKEVTDERFTSHERQFERLESKMNWIISLLVGGMVLPIFLHLLKLI